MQCDFPFNLRLVKPLPDYRGGFIYNVPTGCGRCYNCKKNKSNEWSFRITEHLRHTENGYFVTLTYATETVPMTDNGITTLRKKDVSDFIKRLRKYESKTKEVNYGYLKSGLKYDIKNKLSFFAAGEYGELRFRPHYHLILMNVRNTENIYKAWSTPKYNHKTKEYDYIQIGKIDIKPAHINNIDYAVKYMHKQNDKIYWKIKNGAQKEFHLTSKKIGATYVTPDTIRFHTSSPDNHYLITERNYKIPMPKYYRRMIYNEVQSKKLIQEIKKRMDEKEQKERSEYGDRYSHIKVGQIKQRQNKFKKSVKKRYED